MNTKRLLSISYGHFAIDILNSSIAMILTAVSADFGISVSQIGFAAMIYTSAASLSQPFFGILADRLRGRYLGAAGLFWTMFFFALAPFMPSYPALVLCLTIGALGSGAFHPVGMVTASAAGGHHPTTATSIFFVLGQSGLALGPLISGIVLQEIGLQGLPLMALGMFPAVIFMAMYLREPILDEVTHSEHASSGERSFGAMSGRGVLVVVAFILIIALRSTTWQSFVTLLPKYFDDLGYSSAMYGAMIGVFILGGAMGTFVGGILGDRYNRRLIIFGAMLLTAPFAYAMLFAQGLSFFILAALAGAFLNVPHSILLVMAQRLLPRRKGMIGGAVLGLMFVSGAVTAWIASWFADWLGLAAVLSVVALLPIGAGVCALVLPSTRGAQMPRPKEPATA